MHWKEQGTNFVGDNIHRKSEPVDRASKLIGRASELFASAHILKSNLSRKWNIHIPAITRYCWRNSFSNLCIDQNAQSFGESRMEWLDYLKRGIYFHQTAKYTCHNIWFFWCLLVFGHTFSPAPPVFRNTFSWQRNYETYSNVRFRAIFCKRSVSKDIRFFLIFCKTISGCAHSKEISNEISFWQIFFKNCKMNTRRGARNEAAENSTSSSFNRIINAEPGQALPTSPARRSRDLAAPQVLADEYAKHSNEQTSPTQPSS